MELAAQPRNWTQRISIYPVLLWLQIPLLAIVLYSGFLWARDWFDQPLQDIEIRGEFSEIVAKDLRLAVWDSASPRYLDIDLNQIKGLLEGKPWVHEVDVRRTWPASIVIKVQEENPVARWGERGLLNSDGEVFVPASLEHYQDLPYMQGPPHKGFEMMQQFRAFNQLLRPLKLGLSELYMEPRGAWNMQLSNGIWLSLGRGRLIEKLRRFSQVYSSELVPYSDKIEQLDMRYTNGMTVTWKLLANDSGLGSSKAARSNRSANSKR